MIFGIIKIRLRKLILNVVKNDLLFEFGVDVWGERV